MVLREAQRIGLTDAQRDLFERDGYLVVEDALDTDLVPRLTDAIDRVWSAHRDTPPVAGAASHPSLTLWSPSGIFSDVDGAPGSEAIAMLGGTSSCITVT
jgi:hypothetical protein